MASPWWERFTTLVENGTARPDNSCFSATQNTVLMGVSFGGVPVVLLLDFIVFIVSFSPLCWKAYRKKGRLINYCLHNSHMLVHELIPSISVFQHQPLYTKYTTTRQNCKNQSIPVYKIHHVIVCYGKCSLTHVLWFNTAKLFDHLYFWWKEKLYTIKSWLWNKMRDDSWFSLRLVVRRKLKYHIEFKSNLVASITLNLNPRPEPKQTAY